MRNHQRRCGPAIERKRRQTKPRHYLLVVVGVVVFSFFLSRQTVRAGEGSADERLLDGLRARRLFDLAELYCKQRLERADLPDGERLDLVLELSRTIAAHAIESPADARPPLETG